jgi:transketolase
VIYDKKEQFPIADFKVLRQGRKDSIVLIGSGITLHESLKASTILQEQGISAAVIDLYCIKPLNIKKLSSFIKEHGNKIIITEDHYGEGGIGEMLSRYLQNSEIKMKFLSISEIPHSGTSAELLEAYGISAKHIAIEAKVLCQTYN